MTNPITNMAEMLNKYLWPKEPDQEPVTKTTDEKVKEVNPLRKRADSKPQEPTWAKDNPYASGRCTE